MIRAFATHLTTALVAVAGTSVFFLGRPATKAQPEIVKCDQSTEMTPDGPRVHTIPEAFAYVVAGNAKFRAGDALGAESEYMRALTVDPKSVELLIRLASTQEHLRKYGEALRNFQTALALDPDNNFALAGLGAAAYRAHNLPKAIDLYKQSLEKDAHFAGAHWGIAWAYRDLGAYQHAIDHLDKYLATNPDKAHAAFARDEKQRMEQRLQANDPKSAVEYGSGSNGAG